MKAKSVLMRWRKLGVAFNVASADSTPDIERLLVDTAVVLPENARLFSAVISWLCRNYRLVCRHRLSGFAEQISDSAASAVLGLVLDIVKSRIATDHFNIIIKKCRPLKKPIPLFVVDRSSESLAAMAQAAADEVCVKWGLWCQAVQLKDDVIRPLDWILAENPALRNRAIFNGNLRASILQTLVYDRQAGNSESALARCCGVTRKAVREALDHLEFCQMVRRSNVAGRVRIALQ
jgi:hypothetical protein